MSHQSHQPPAFRYVGHNPDMMGRLWFRIAKEPDVVHLWSAYFEEPGRSGQTWSGDPVTATHDFHQVFQP